MTSDTTPLLAQQRSSTAKVGDYIPARDTDERTPCPLVNCLANHGYINRDGKHVYERDLNAALQRVGLGYWLRAILCRPTYLEYEDPKHPRHRSFLGKIWYYVSHPWAIILSKFACRTQNQKDAKSGCPFLNLHEISRHGAIEHDISLCRKDFAQGNNHTRVPALVEEMLSHSKDGVYLTVEELADFRRDRMTQQLKDNPGLTCGKGEHALGCGQIAFFTMLLGDGHKVRKDYVRALFLEERLPYKEGWKPRSWWHSMTFLPFFNLTQKVVGMVGVTV